MGTRIGHASFSNSFGFVAQDASLSAYLNKSISDAGDNRTGMTDVTGAATTFIFSTCLLQAVVDPLENRTSYTHDNVGRQTSVQTPLGFRSTPVYDDAGQVSATVDPLGNRTSYQYDPIGNRTTLTDANGKVTTSVYQSNSNRLQASVDSNGNRTSFSYDAASERTLQAGT